MMVITGANGRLGRSIATELSQSGHSHGVRLTTRTPEKAEDLKALGFDIVKADFGNSESLTTAFQAAKTILIISATGSAKDRIPLHKNVIEAAIAAKPERIIYTSRVNPSPDSVYAYASIHALSESLICNSGIPFTVVRNNEYSENLSFSINEALQSGTIALPGSTGKVPYISVADIARVIARLLTETGHTNKIYELNGPEALSPLEIAQALENACGTPIKRLTTSADEYATRVKARGRPQFVVDMIKTLHNAIDLQEFSTVYHDAKNILGEEPESLSHYLKRVYGTA